jgi:hypothetical protein
MRLGWINYQLFSGPGAHIPARAEVERVIEDANMPVKTFSHSHVRILVLGGQSQLPFGRRIRCHTSRLGRSYSSPVSGLSGQVLHFTR